MADAKPTQPANGGTSAPSASPANNAGTNQPQAKPSGGSQSASTPEGGAAHKVSSSTGHLGIASHPMYHLVLGTRVFLTAHPCCTALHLISSHLTSSIVLFLFGCHGPLDAWDLPPTIAWMLIAFHEYVTDPRPGPS